MHIKTRKHICNCIVCNNLNSYSKKYWRKRLRKKSKEEIEAQLDDIEPKIKAYVYTSE